MIFNSRNSEYKFPKGAVPCGTELMFRLHFDKLLQAHDVYLCIAKDGVEFEYIKMFKDDKGSEDIFFVSFIPSLGPAPYWYHFKLETKFGSRFVSRQFLGEGKLSEEAYSFQQTVYDKDYKIPSWYGEGITYNIFPDRFYSTSKKKQRKHSVLHKNWCETPVYLPNKEGEILNNDFFGGDLNGITEKLDYLKELKISTIYLNPIFKAYSNHRYDTGDYKVIDDYLGTEEDFINLCKVAKEKGIRIILDGVFSHTGYDSLYFNGRGNYDSVGAFNSKDSPYYDWYSFGDTKKDYKAWWGIYTLPEVNETNQSYMDFIIEDEDSVIKKWIKLGASGFRLDVADELPDEFINKLNIACKEVDSEAIVIGEVWEDASTKESYSERRKYVYGQYLDSVMNYVLKDAILDFLLNGKAVFFRDKVETLLENYPIDFLNSAMNVIGTHDTMRALTFLSGTNFETRKERAHAKLKGKELEIAIKRLKLASLLQFTMPGSPCIYYGDEVGVCGFEDPFNRRTYPWGKENLEVFDWYKKITTLRATNKCLIYGDLVFLYAKNDILAYRRAYEGNGVLIYINRSDTEKHADILGQGVNFEPFGYKIIEIRGE